jgi:hypothetical protein
MWPEVDVVVLVYLFRVHQVKILKSCGSLVCVHIAKLKGIDFLATHVQRVSQNCFSCRTIDHDSDSSALLSSAPS